MSALRKPVPLTLCLLRDRNHTRTVPSARARSASGKKVRDGDTHTLRGIMGDHADVAITWEESVGRHDRHMDMDMERGGGHAPGMRINVTCKADRVCDL